MEHNAENICRTVIWGKEQNLNEEKAEFRISTHFADFGQSHIFSMSWKPISQLNTAWEPCLYNAISDKRLKKIDVGIQLEMLMVMFGQT